MDAPVMQTAEPATQPANDGQPFLDTKDESDQEEDTLSYFAKLAQD